MPTFGADCLKGFEEIGLDTVEHCAVLEFFDTTEKPITVICAV